MQIISVKPKATKERLVNQLVQEVGGVAAYWNKIPVEQLRSLYETVNSNNDAKAALANLVSQLQETRQTNTKLNRQNFGLSQTAGKYERIADHLIKMNALLEQQKNELLQQIQNMVNCLHDYEKSEIRQAVIAISQQISSWIK